MKMPSFNIKIPSPSSLRASLLKGIIRVLFYSPIGVVLALLIGMRAFETGALVSKGSTVKITGVCQIAGKDRLPAFNEDQITVTKSDKLVLAGVIRKTREAVTCNIDSIAISSLPLLKDFKNNPTESLELALPKAPEKENPTIPLSNRSLRVSGICLNLKTNSQETIVDQIMLTSSGKKIEGSEDYAILGVIKDKQMPVQCVLGSFNYEVVTISEKETQPVAPVPQDEDINGKTFLVTSTCFPDDRVPKTKNSDQLFYPLINAKVQITGYRYVNGKIAWISGALIKKKTMIVCDESKYPIQMEIFDPSSMKLEDLDAEKPK